MEDLVLILQEVKSKWGLGTVNAIKKKIGDDNIIWKGTLLSSIGYNQDDTLDGNIKFKMADFGEYIDEGTGMRGPRKQPIPKKSIPGIAFHIKPWADSKGLNAWAVATNIQKNGLAPRKFFKDVIAIRMNDLATDLQKAYTDYLTATINKQQKP